MPVVRSAAAAFTLAAGVLMPCLASAVPTLTIGHAARHDESRPLREILAELPASTEDGSSAGPYVVPNVFPKEGRAWQSEFMRELAARNIQFAPTGVPGPVTLQSFLGLVAGAASGPGNAGTSVPPDTNGDVSPTHFIQWLNTRWAIFDKTGTRLTASAPGNSFFVGFGGRCETTNSGDPIALWDDKAQRWVMSQFTTGPTVAVPARQCFAISTTSDPLGTYYRYEFLWPADTAATAVFGDYPHIGIWHEAGGRQNAYTMVTHEFSATSVFFGAAFIAIERDKMLAGQPAAMVRVGGIDAYGAQPAHLEGAIDAAAGSCAPFVHFDSTNSDYLFWDMCLDWVTPANSTLSATAQRVPSKTPFVPSFDTIAQLGTASQLDAFGSNVMYRASARAFPPGAPNSMSLVINHVAKANGSHTGVRWVHFGLRPPGGSFDVIYRDGYDAAGAPVGLVKSIVDEGVYAPDTDSRWMAGINIDAGGNIGLGYNVSSSTLNPKLRVTGRTVADAAGTMRDENDCTPATTGSQTGLFSGRGRWGDYTSMSVDPVDECTFWFTGEYLATTSNASWSTRICSFKFDECGLPEYSLVSETPTRVEMCGSTPGPDPSWRILAGTFGGFASSVALTTDAAPAGTTPTFSQNPIAPTPGISTLTLVGGHGLASGEFAFRVDGTSGSEVRSLDLEFGVSATAPVAPALLLPANAAAGVKVRPAFSWAPSSGALTYDIEVATSAAFTTIVASATVTGTSWTSSVALSSTTTYFWRVRPTNYCGDGATSTVSSFTTGTPGVCPVGTTTTIVFQDDVQGGVNGWTTDGTGGTNWAQQAAAAGTGLTGTVWTIPNNAVTSDRGLISPVIAIPANATAATLSYDAFHNFEIDGANGCWDATSLELKRGAGAFDYVDEGRLFADAYTGVISAGAPLAGRRAWCHLNSPLPIRALVDLDDTAGQSIQLRYRQSSDSNTTAGAPNGFALRNIRIEACTP
jgi:hypothetical protein